MRLISHLDFIRKDEKISTVTKISIFSLVMSTICFWKYTNINENKTNMIILSPHILIKLKGVQICLLIWPQSLVNNILNSKSKMTLIVQCSVSSTNNFISLPKRKVIQAL